MASLSGILPATLTPVDSEGRFVESQFALLLERLYGAGVDGIYVAGYSGEGLQQPLAQRMALAEAAVRWSPPGKDVIVHVGSALVPDAFELARHAARAGVRAIASVPPPGSDVFADEVAYFERLVEVTELPVLLYYLPGVCGPRSLEQILEICAIDGVMGLKYSATNVHEVWEIARQGHVVFNGCDELLTAGWMMGASGGIGGFYNIAPDVLVEIGRAARRRDWTRARAAQDELNELVAVVLKFPLLASLKLLTKWSGIDCGGPLAPKRPLTRDEEAALRTAVLGTTLGARVLSATSGTIV